MSLKENTVIRDFRITAEDDIIPPCHINYQKQGLALELEVE